MKQDEDRDEKGERSNLSNVAEVSDEGTTSEEDETVASLVRRGTKTWDDPSETKHHLESIKKSPSLRVRSVYRSTSSEGLSMPNRNTDPPPVPILPSTLRSHLPDDVELTDLQEMARRHTRTPAGLTSTPYRFPLPSSIDTPPSSSFVRTSRLGSSSGGLPPPVSAPSPRGGGGGGSGSYNLSRTTSFDGGLSTFRGADVVTMRARIDVLEETNRKAEQRIHDLERTIQDQLLPWTLWAAEMKAKAEAAALTSSQEGEQQPEPRTSVSSVKRDYNLPSYMRNGTGSTSDDIMLTPPPFFPASSSSPSPTSPLRYSTSSSVKIVSPRGMSGKMTRSSKSMRMSGSTDEDIRVTNMQHDIWYLSMQILFYQKAMSKILKSTALEQLESQCLHYWTSSHPNENVPYTRHEFDAHMDRQWIKLDMERQVRRPSECLVM